MFDLSSSRVLFSVIRLTVISLLYTWALSLSRQTTTVSELDRIISDICDDDPAVNEVPLLPLMMCLYCLCFDQSNYVWPLGQTQPEGGSGLAT